MIIVRLLFSEPVGWLGHHQLYLDLGADIVMESITLIESLDIPLCPSSMARAYTASAFCSSSLF